MQKIRNNPLLGRSITVIYKITDPVLYKKINPLDYKHEGVESYCMILGDLCARHDELKEALSKIMYEGDSESRHIAKSAIARDNLLGDIS
jgi:hypothetical protein